ncbi:MAG: large conductance mechanosensitive channel protein MscL [Bacillota bacterium]|nr:large conductance mechanosensitive channel protein MscL [Bacillota bacterium]
MLKEFKDFISRGNVLDMAVGVVVGGAFTAIVNSLVGDILMPIVGGITGGIDFTSYVAKIGDASINYGTFIQAIINFLIVAWVIFMIVKAVNKMREKADALKKKEEEAVAEAPAEPSEEILLLREIRDHLAEK